MPSGSLSVINYTDLDQQAKKKLKTLTTVFFYLKTDINAPTLKIKKKPIFCSSGADPDPGSSAFFTPGSGMDKQSRVADPDPDWIRIQSG